MYFARELSRKFQSALPGEDAQQIMAPEHRYDIVPEFTGTYTPSAVLLLLYPEQELWHMVFIRRNVYDGPHSGQISFPGGKFEAEDIELVRTALRETAEEIGINKEHVEIIGKLSTLKVPVSGFLIHPFVGIHHRQPLFKPDPTEVQEIISIPLSQLFNPQNKHSELWEFRGRKVNVPFYKYNGIVIWGATAMILSEFEQLMNRK